MSTTGVLLRVIRGGILSKQRNYGSSWQGKNKQCRTSCIIVIVINYRDYV